MTTENNHHCMQCIDKAILVSRATWKCAECGKDVSMMYVLWAEAMIANGENNIVTETKPWWKEEFDNLFTKTMNHTYLHHLGTSREALKMEQFILKVESETRKKTIEEIKDMVHTKNIFKNVMFVENGEVARYTDFINEINNLNK